MQKLKVLDSLNLVSVFFVHSQLLGLIFFPLDLENLVCVSSVFPELLCWLEHVHVWQKVLSELVSSSGLVQSAPVLKGMPM